MPENTKPKIYFKNLNAIRFFAASIVICHHIEQNKSNFNLPSYWQNEVVIMVGRLGVILFFVISGFLITYLLLKEKQFTNTISVKDFYLRRIFRIWPLYFLIVFLAFFVLPNIDFLNFGKFDSKTIVQNIKVNLPLYLLLLPNLATNLSSSLHFASHLWSIGAEEQFYLVWPVLNKKISNKFILMASVLVFYQLLKYLFLNLPPSAFASRLNGFWFSIPIDCMAIGGFFSLLLHGNSRFISKIKLLIFAKLIQWFILSGTIFLIVIGFQPTYLHEEFYSVLFGIIIINFAANENRIFSLDNPILNYLGKISYGLYMYHLIVVVFLIKVVQYFEIFRSIILYPAVFFLTIILASFSYEYFELPFIWKKQKYSKFNSGQ